VNQKDNAFFDFFLSVAKQPAKKSIDRFFHAEHLFEKKSPLGGVADVGFSSEKRLQKAEKLHIFHKACNFSAPFFRFKRNKNTAFQPHPVLV